MDPTIQLIVDFLEQKETETMRKMASSPSAIHFEEEQGIQGDMADERVELNDVIDTRRTSTKANEDESGGVETTSLGIITDVNDEVTVFTTNLCLDWEVGDCSQADVAEKSDTGDDRSKQSGENK